jgi:hypothetical protein
MKYHITKISFLLLLCNIIIFFSINKSDGKDLVSLKYNIVFAVRKITQDNHWYANFGYRSYDEKKKNYAKGGGLRLLNPKTGKTKWIINDSTGTFRDPILNYEGNKILFSYRKGDTDHFHLYEINTDGTGLKQLTAGPFSDLEPTYLPSGDIIFISSRCNQWVPCWLTQVATLYKCKADGSDIHRISGNIEQENTPWMLQDGRICYTRWEYIDRSRTSFHGLWTVNPDGTEHMTLFGNLHPGSVYIDAKPIPGTDKLIMIQSPGHGQKEHGGLVSLLSLNKGPDDLKAEKVIARNDYKEHNIRITKYYRDPYPLSANKFLVARGSELLLMNEKGDFKVIYKLTEQEAEEDYWLHEPRPIRSKPKERISPEAVDRSKTTGKLIVLDTTIGRNMEGVKKGEIKKLLILEELPKPINYSGGMEPLSYGGSFCLKRVIGTVPVEPDGSAYMELPANRALAFVALDKDDLSVKRMQSFVSVMPGETSTCIGCHESRTESVPVSRNVMATKRKASIPEPIKDMPEIFEYPRDIQPILDKHCLSCHDVKNRKGGVLMTGDRGPHYSHSYFELISRLQVADGRDLARGNYPPRKIGSSASYLVKKIDGSHHNVKLSEKEIRKIKLWIDASATYPGTYASLGTGMLNGGPKEYKESIDVMERRCNECHIENMKLPESPVENPKPRAQDLFYKSDGNHKKTKWTPPWIKPFGDGKLKPGSKEWMKKYAPPAVTYSKHILYNLSFPEKSVMLLAPLSKKAGGYGICPKGFESKSDPDYKILLESIQLSKRRMDEIKRFDMADYQPRLGYIREMIRFGILPADFKYGDPVDVYETDRKYWESLYINNFK